VDKASQKVQWKIEATFLIRLGERERKGNVCYFAIFLEKN
jgi:hypothetical protein